MTKLVALFMPLLVFSNAFANSCPVFKGDFTCDQGMANSMETKTGPAGETIYNFNGTEVIADGKHHTSFEEGLTINYSAFCADDSLKLVSVIIMGKHGYIQNAVGTFKNADSKFIHESNTKIFTAEGKLVGEFPSTMTCEPAR